MLALADRFLRGSIPCLVTPFRGHAVDYDAYAKLVEVQIDNGSHGILINGPASEPASLTTEERNRLVEVAVEAAAGRVLVVVATGAHSFAETEVLTRHAGTDPDVDALLVAAPPSCQSRTGLVAMCKALNRAHDKPWLIAVDAGRVTPEIDVDCVIALDRVCPTLVGLCLHSSDPGLLSNLFLEIGEDFRIFVAAEEQSLPLLAVGASGLMNAAGNLCPRSYADMCDAVRKGDLDTARDLYSSLCEIHNSINADVIPTTMKYMMKRLGIIPGNDHRLPLVPASPALERQLDGVLRQSGMIG